MSAGAALASYLWEAKWELISGLVAPCVTPDVSTWIPSPLISVVCQWLGRALRNPRRGLVEHSLPAAGTSPLASFGGTELSELALHLSPCYTLVGMHTTPPKDVPPTRPAGSRHGLGASFSQHTQYKPVVPAGLDFELYVIFSV